MSKNEKASFNWFPGHMNKSIKEIEEMIPVVDLVIEIVDSRAPFSTQNPLLRRLLSKRPRLIIMSKGDLADPNVTTKWIDHFEMQGDHTYLINDKNANITTDIERLIHKMTKEKQDRDKRRGIEVPQLNVLVVGIPNVGKSTFIQNISKGKMLKKGNKPGVTRGSQRIVMTPQITLIDTPGILPSRFENETIACNCAAANAIRLEVIPRERFAAKIVKYVYNNYPNAIDKLYSINVTAARPIDYDDSFGILELIAKKMKFLILDDTPDIERAVDLFINDLHQNRFGRISFEQPMEVANTIEFNTEDDIDFTVESDLTIEW
jgi:ribosome biogenesis GTPase A